MSAPTVYDLFGTWERGLSQMPAQRALGLLALAHPAASDEELAALSIGRRDAALFAVREQLFGERCSALASCPSCGSDAELTFDLDELRVDAKEQASDEVHIEIGGYTARFRVPSAGVMAALSARLGTALDADAVLERCLVHATRGEDEVTARELPDEARTAVAQAMALADPQADVRLALACPHCSRQWDALFDIVSFLWSELQAWCQRALGDVHELASAYGWREADILALSPARRQRYLDMVRG